MVGVTLTTETTNFQSDFDHQSNSKLSICNSIAILPFMDPKDDHVTQNKTDIDPHPVTAGGRTNRTNGGGNGVRFFLESSDDELVTVGDYEFYPRDKLGEGAYGCVYRGKQLSSDSYVAMKLVDTSRLKEGELEAIVKAQSECVVQFLDVVKTDRLTYIIMELCDTDLSKFLAKYGKLDAANLLKVGRCLADGYLVLHRNGIVHRDIKPQNILLKLEEIDDIDEETQPKILSVKFTDFGCSRVSSGDENEGMPCNLAGTFFYMAPEVGANVVDCHEYDEEVDMWSIGVVLYQCMTGQVPFDERQLCRLFLHAIDGNDAGYSPPDPIEGPEHYRQVVKKLLQLDPSARLKPVQLHSFLSHDQPSAFIQCLRHGSCSDENRESIKALMKEQHLKNETSSFKNVWKRRISLDNLPSIRRTASALLGRFVAACGQQNHKQQLHNL